VDVIDFPGVDSPPLPLGVQAFSREDFLADTLRFDEQGRNGRRNDPSIAIFPP
jgi:hypothetical protein